MDQIDNPNPTDEQRKLIAQIKAIDAENKKSNDKKVKPNDKEVIKEQKNPHFRKGFYEQVETNIQQAIHPTKGKSQQQIIDAQCKQLFQLLNLK